METQVETGDTGERLPSLSDPATWPLRMRRVEVAHVLRISVRTLFARVRTHRFPSPDSDRMWSRDVVARYAAGGIQNFDRDAARGKRRRTNA